MTVKKAFCLVSIAPVRAEASDTSEIVTQLLFGELVEVYETYHPWSKIITLYDAYEGFVDHKHLRFLSDKEVRRWREGLSFQWERELKISTPWGLQRTCRGSFLPENGLSFNIGGNAFSILSEREDAPKTIIECAKDYLNTPYLWGGKSPFGIDCSGYTQIVYRLFDRNLPRDASAQVEHGRIISFDEIEAGDLAYFTNNSGKVTHVGILDGEGGIYHASGYVRLDRITPEGIIHAESEALTHSLHLLKRM